MRALLAVIALPLVIAPSFAAQTRLDEGAAIRTVLARDDLRNATAGAVDASQAEAHELGLPLNPNFEYERERTGAEGGTVVQDTFRLAQPIDIAGRRGLQQDAAIRRADATLAETRHRYLEAGGEARKLFYALLLRAQQKEATAAWAARLADAEGVLAKLVKGREVSGYDGKRLTRERVAAEAKGRAVDADLNAAWERLRAMMALPPGTGVPSLDGVLLPPVPDDLDVLLARLDGRPDLLASRAKAAASELEQRAADRGWIPELTLGAGVRQVEQADRRDNGVLFTVSTPLPVFNRGQAASRKAAAQTRATMGDFALARAKAEGEIRGLWRQTTQLRETAMQFRDEALRPSRDLTRIAEGAYRGGEAGILDLLDAYRAQLEAETTVLELEAAAREAFVSLTLAAGDQIP